MKEPVRNSDPAHANLDAPEVRSIVGGLGDPLRKTPPQYTRTTKQALIKELVAIDSPDVEALIAFGANLPMAAIADEAERWLNKPVISVNIATYWHALRHGGIEDKVQHSTRLMREF